MRPKFSENALKGFLTKELNFAYRLRKMESFSTGSTLQEWGSPIFSKYGSFHVQEESFVEFGRFESETSEKNKISVDDNSHLLKLLNNLKQSYSTDFLRHSQMIADNQNLRKSVLSLEKALSETRKSTSKCKPQELQVLEEDNEDLQSQIESQKKELSQFYTSEFVEHRNPVPDLREIESLRNSLKEASKEQECLLQELRSVRRDLFQERHVRLRLEGDIKSIALQNSRPGWAKK
jgi:hypothetical protein